MKASPLAKVEQWASDNLKCARIILDNPEKYPGLMQIWAKKYLAKVDPKPPSA